MDDENEDFGEMIFFAMIELTPEEESWLMMYPPFPVRTGRLCSDPACHCGGQNNEMAYTGDSSTN